MRAVNLLPRDDVPKSFEAKRGVVFGAGGGAAFLTVALTALMLSAGGAVSEHQSRVDSAKAELAALPTAPNSAETALDDAALTSELNTRSSALSTAIAGRVAWDSVLRQVSQLLPEDVWLNSLSNTSSATSDVDPAAETVVGVTIVGSTYSQSGVARLLARLAVAPMLENVRLQSSANVESGSSTLVDFTIAADVKTGGDES